MAVIAPFRGYTYNPQAIPDLFKVMAPPFDLIFSSPQKEKYMNLHPYNISHISVGGYPDRYQQVAQLFLEWIDQKVLIQATEPCLYLYEILAAKEMEINSKTQEEKYHGDRIRLVGFIAITRLEHFSSGVIFPHEETFSTPKADRLALLSATKAHFDPIFALYSDPDRQIYQIYKNITNSAPPLISVLDTFQNASHIIWEIVDQDLIEKIKQLLAAKSLLIADGHHRYEAALLFSKEMQRTLNRQQEDSSFNYILTFLVAMEEPGLCILPTHRLIKNIPKFNPVDFLGVIKQKVSRVDKFSNKAAFLNAIESANQKNKEVKMHYFGLYLGNESYYLLAFPKSNAEEISTSGLEKILKSVFSYNELTIGYTHSANEAISLVRCGEYQAAFLVTPPEKEQVKNLAISGIKLPQKSTYFYPKPLTGLVIYKME